MTLLKLMRQAAVEGGKKSGTTKAESAENRQLKTRIPLLEQENEVLHRVGACLSRASLPGKGTTRS